MERKAYKRQPNQPFNRLAHQIDHRRQQYAVVQQQYYLNTLRASGIRGTVYTYRNHGAACTCEPSYSLLDDAGVLAPAEVDNVIQRAFQTGQEIPTFGANDFVIDPAAAGMSDELTSDVAMDEADDTVASSYDATACGICFGSGIEGGYEVDHGYRRVFTVQHPNVAQNFVRETTTYPNYFRLIDPDEEGTVEFETVLPFGFTVECLRLWNNEQILETDTWTLTGLELTGEPVTLLVTTQQDWTHLELQVSDGQASYIDFPQLPSNFSPDLRGVGALDTTLNLGVGTNVAKYSIVRDSKHHRAWMVNEVTPHLDGPHIVYWEAQVRLVQPHELHSRLFGR